MLCGMFGKLPSKRDFVSYNMPRPFLNEWEDWLQTAVAASRHRLGAAWQDIFLGFPVWHYWFGRRVFGQAVTGALMPSVDGMGRYFPLCICACEAEGIRLLPPPDEELDVWHAACQHFLLQMLEDELEDDPAALLEGLAFAPHEAVGPSVDFQHPIQLWSSEDGSLDRAFGQLRAMNDDAVHGSRSYWWTGGGVNHKAQLIAMDGRADPSILCALMTGAFH